MYINYYILTNIIDKVFTYNYFIVQPIICVTSFFTGITKNQNTDIDLIARLIIHLDTNIQVVQILERNIIQKNCIVEEIHHLATNRLVMAVQMFPLNSIGLKTLKHSMIMKMHYQIHQAILNLMYLK